MSPAKQEPRASDTSCMWIGAAPAIFLMAGVCALVFVGTLPRVVTSMSLPVPESPASINGPGNTTGEGHR
jgi:hypothetical protein